MMTTLCAGHLDGASNFCSAFGTCQMSKIDNLDGPKSGNPVATATFNSRPALLTWFFLFFDNRDEQKQSFFSAT